MKIGDSRAPCTACLLDAPLVLGVLRQQIQRVRQRQAGGFVASQQEGKELQRAEAMHTTTVVA